MHTKTPWLLQFKAPWANTPIIVDSEGEPICSTMSSGEHKEDCPDAKRIVACVNACEGIPTEELEKGIVGQTNKLLEEWSAKSHGFDCQQEQMLKTVNILNRLGGK